MFIDKVKKTIQKHRMFSAGSCVVVAVSGGPDSVCLLRVLAEIAPDYGLRLHVAHLDHQFRGAESATEAGFVRTLAKDLGIAATIGSVDVPAYCAEQGLSRQAGAREVRYRFLHESAAKVGADRIALGHTANDQAETLLMRLIRGAGLSGLSSIPPTRDEIIRPLIDCTRTEVLAYLRELRQDFATDPSNFDPAYTRNRVRIELLPVLERFNPRIIDTLVAEIEVLQDEDDAISAETDMIAARILRQERGSVRISRMGFLGLLPAFRRRLLRTALDMASGGTPAGISWPQTKEALAFTAEAQTGRTMELPGGLALSREYDDLIIGVRKDEEGFCVRIVVPGRTEVAAAGLTVVTEVIDGAQASEKENNLWQAQFDYDKISLPLYLRSRRDGDRFRPAGMPGGTKKLQDLFVDEKVPQGRRSSVPLLATQDDVVWVVGMRLDGRFLPGAGTKQVLVVTVRQTP